MVIKKPSRRSIRLPQWNYSEEGYYFVTVCSYQRTLLFGSVGAIHESPVSDNINMQLNSYGKIVKKAWLSLPDRFPMSLDYYQIMPNHVHGIIVINDDTTRAHHDAPLHKPHKTKRSILSQCIGYFKMNTTKQIHQTFKNNDPVWQRNYYEHIIRHEKELNEIREYILINPSRWQYDRNNPVNITKFCYSQKL